MDCIRRNYRDVELVFEKRDTGKYSIFLRLQYADVIDLRSYDGDVADPNINSTILSHVSKKTVKKDAIDKYVVPALKPLIDAYLAGNLEGATDWTSLLNEACQKRWGAPPKFGDLTERQGMGYYTTCDLPNGYGCGGNGRSLKEARRDAAQLAYLQNF